MKITREAFKAVAAKTVTGRPCEFRRNLSILSKSDLAEVVAALRDVSLPVPAIQKVLEVNGVRTSISTLANHRRGRCFTCRADFA